MRYAILPIYIRVDAGDPTYADTILDHLVHNAHRIELVADSLQRPRGKQANSG